MNTVIYYFSATGNSLAVARDLADELGGAGIVPITKRLNPGVEEADSVGVVFPVYMFGLPLIVRDFLKSLKVKPGTYVFSVATLGGLPGRAHTLTKNILNKRGIELSAGFSVMMPGNYTPLYEAVSAEKQEEMFSNEKVKVKEIARLVLKRARGIVEEKPRWINFLLYILLYRGGSAQIAKSAAGFWITDACTRCGLCAKVCPVNNIEMRAGLPVWLGHCQHCMACLQWCPVAAIQYRRSTMGRKRYHHPEITAEDIMGQR